MTPRLLIDTAAIPGGEEMRLVRHGNDYIIMLGRNELMNSRMSGSEEALATLALARAGEARHVLIGGLGMGFTLRATLGVVGPAARVVVAELVPAVVDWGRGPMASIFAGSLDDPRVEIAVEDVGVTIARGGWDAILLDVDNGPDGLTRQGNDALYDMGGLARARAALRPGGVLAIWSAGEDTAFTNRLRRAGFRVGVADVRARVTKGPRHVIWLATPA